MTDVPRRKPVVLIVDDDAAHRLLIRRRIETECVVIEAASSEEAREIMRVRRVDILSSDSNLVSLDGKELVRTQKTDNGYLGAVIFVSAAAGRPDVHMEMIDAGADAILEKPFLGDEIRAVFRELATLGDERRHVAGKRKRQQAQRRRISRLMDGLQRPRIARADSAEDEDPSHD